MKKALFNLLIAVFIFAGFSVFSNTHAQEKWWGKFGKPQYGGKITVVTNRYAPNYDVTDFMGGEWELWHEALFEPDWTLDRKIWSFQGGFVPDQYQKGNLVESWEQTDPSTITVHIRKGVHWQNKPPVNGREFTSDDVVQHYDRLMGTGSGYTQPNPIYAGTFSNWEKVTLKDRYTVVFKFKTPCTGTALQAIAQRVTNNTIEAPESVREQGGKITDWTRVVGTGPWMLTDVSTGSSLTFSKNPVYWCNDPRYPENQAPYVDTLRLVIVPDPSTQLAALRSGQIDILSSVNWQNSKSLQQTNPNLQKTMVSAGAWGVMFRLDKKPFSDINVRKALQMSINRKAIAENYYGGMASKTPSGILTPAYKGYAFDYNRWPQSLKDDYNYNPVRAQQLLKNAGYPDGFNTNVVAPSNFDMQLLQVIQGNFKEIGVDMSINTMDWPAWAPFVQAGKHDQMAFFIGALYTQEPLRVIDEFYSKGRDHGVTAVSDPKYDAIRNRFFASGSATDAARVMQEADRHIIEQNWLVLAPEYYTNTYWQPHLKGYSGEDMLWGQGITYSRLWINKSQK